MGTRLFVWLALFVPMAFFFDQLAMDSWSEAVALAVTAGGALAVAVSLVKVRLR